MRPRILILVPTQLELDPLVDCPAVLRGDVDVALCGFGPVAAGCRAMQALCQRPYRHVVLCGVAGTYDDAVALGSVLAFGGVALDGVGVFDGGSLHSGYALGFDPTVPDRIDGLEVPAGVPHAEGLLTVCVCSGSIAEADERARKYAPVTGEDMEGFAVAMACRLRTVPLTILRGVSNRAGDRDKRNWRIGEALRSVRSALDVALPAILERP